MAKDELTGNMPMENMISYFDKHEIETGLDMDAFGYAMKGSDKVFH